MAKEVSSNGDILLYFLALFLPPVSVFMKRGCGADFWINICLSILAWLPGVIHAFWIISKYGDHKVQSHHAPAQQGGYHHAPPPHQGGYPAAAPPGQQAYHAPPPGKPAY